MREFTDVPGIQLPPSIENTQNVYWLYSILIDEEESGTNRDNIMTYLQEHNIENRPLFHPLHLMKPFITKRLKEYPISEKLSGSGITLPSGILLKEEDVNRIVGLISDRIENH